MMSMTSLSDVYSVISGIYPSRVYWLGLTIMIASSSPMEPNESKELLEPKDALFTLMLAVFIGTIIDGF